MGDIAIPFFKLLIANGDRFHTRCDVLDSRNGRFHLPVVSFFSCLDSFLRFPLFVSVEDSDFPAYHANYWAFQPVCAAAPITPQRASSKTFKCG